MILPADLERITRYLTAMMQGRSKPEAEDMGTLPFVTISRQAGAGGHSLAEAIVKAMDLSEEDPIFRHWQVFDQEICSRLLNDPKLKVSMQFLLTEEYHNQVEDYLLQLLTRSTPQYTVYRRLFKLVRTLALCGKAVLVGRGAACYTRGIPGGVHVRLAASESFRVKRLQDRFGLSAIKARRMMTVQDAARRKLVRDFFKKDIDDPLLYDAVWNTDSVPIETIASMIIDLIRVKMDRTKNRSLQLLERS